MRRTFRTPLLLLGVAGLLLGSTASAQPFLEPVQSLRVAYPVGNNYQAIINLNGVKEEIKLTEEQEKNLQAAQKKQQKAFADLRNAGRVTSQDYQKINEQYQKDVESALTKDQIKRLQQIQFQQLTRYNIMQVFYNPQYREKLKVTPEQQKKAQELQQKQAQAQQSLPRTLTGQKRAEFYRELQEATNDLIIESLTKEQQVTINDLRGEPFKGFDTPRIRPVPRPVPLPVKPVPPIKPEGR